MDITAAMAPVQRQNFFELYFTWDIGVTTIIYKYLRGDNSCGKNKVLQKYLWKKRQGTKTDTKDEKMDKELDPIFNYMSKTKSKKLINFREQRNKFGYRLNICPPTSINE